MRHPSHELLHRRSFLAGALAGASATTSGFVSFDRSSGDQSDRTLEIVSTERGELYYQFVVRGDVERTETEDTVSAGSNDAIILGNDEETTTVRGFTGNPGYGDAYVFDGEIAYFRAVEASTDFFLRLDGEEIPADELNDGVAGPYMGTHEFADPPSIDGTFEIVATERAEVFYKFTVRGDVERTSVSDEIEANSNNDAIIRGNDEETRVVRGFTGNPGYGDAYRIDGELLEVERSLNESDYFFRLDGEEVTLTDLADADDPATDAGEQLRRLQSALDAVDETVAVAHSALLADYRREGLDNLRVALDLLGVLDDPLESMMADANRANERAAQSVLDGDPEGADRYGSETADALRDLQTAVEEDADLPGTAADIVAGVLGNLIEADTTELLGRAAVALDSPQTSERLYGGLVDRVTEIRNRIRSLQEAGYEVALDASEPAIVVRDPRQASGYAQASAVAGSAPLALKPALGIVGSALGKLTLTPTVGMGLVAVMGLYTVGYMTGVAPGPQQLIQRLVANPLFRAILFSKQTTRAMACDAFEMIDSKLEEWDRKTWFERLEFYKTVATGCAVTVDRDYVIDSLTNDFLDALGELLGGDEGTTGGGNTTGDEQRVAGRDGSPRRDLVRR